MDRPLVLSTNRPFIIHKDILVWLVIIQDVDVGSKEWDVTRWINCVARDAGLEPKNSCGLGAAAGVIFIGNAGLADSYYHVSCDVWKYGMIVRYGEKVIPRHWGYQKRWGHTEGQYMAPTNRIWSIWRKRWQTRAGYTRSREGDSSWVVPSVRLDKYTNVVNPVKRVAPKEDFLVCLIPVFGVVEECHFVTSLRTTSPLLVTRDGKLWMLNPLSRVMCDSTCRNGTILKAQSVTCQ